MKKTIIVFLIVCFLAECISGMDYSARECVASVPMKCVDWRTIIKFLDAENHKRNTTNIKKTIEKHMNEIPKVIETVQMLRNERRAIIKQLNLEHLIIEPYYYAQQIEKAEQCIADLSDTISREVFCFDGALEQLYEHDLSLSALERGLSADIERLKEQLKKQ